MPDYTSIRVTEELADELHSRKSRGESYEDVIWQMIESEEIDADALEQLIEKMRDDRESSAHVYAYELEELIEDE